MALQLKRLMPTALVLMAVFTVAGKAFAAETQDVKARILADIAFQYADLEKSPRSLEVLEQAQRSVAEMTERCFQANPLAKVAGGYRLAGQNEPGERLLAEAIQMAQSQEATGCSGSATSPTESLLNRAREYAEGGHLDLALDIGLGLEDPIVLAELAGYLSETGRPRRARQLLNQAIALTQAIDEPFYETQTRTVMAHKLRIAGHPEQALRVLEASLEDRLLNGVDGNSSGEEASLAINAALQVSRELAAVQAEQQAIDVLEQVVPAIAGLKSPFPADRIVYWVDAALQYGDLGRQPEAEAILADALAVAEAMPSGDDQRRDDALSRVAEGYVKLGNLDRGQQLARSIQAAALRARVVQQVAIAYAAAGDTDAAIALVQSVDRSKSALIEVVRYYLAQNQPDQAWEIVQTHQVQGISSEVAVGYLGTGQPEQALEVVRASELEGFEADLAVAFAQSGQSEPAVELATAGQLDYLRPAIARELAQQKQFDSALQVAQSITDDIYKAQALIAIAQAYTTPPAEQGFIQRSMAKLANFLPGGADNAERQKAIEVLEQALQITQSL